MGKGHGKTYRTLRIARKEEYVLYKVILWDRNMPSCTSGAFTCFCEDIDAFEQEWIQLEEDEKTIE